MHHYLTAQLATSHRDSLLAASHQHRQRTAARSGRRTASGRHRPVRYRAGWALIELGLRLVGTPHSA